MPRAEGKLLSLCRGEKMSVAKKRTVISVLLKTVILIYNTNNKDFMCNEKL